MNSGLRQRLNKAIAASLARSGALCQIEKADRDRPGWLRVLAYHRIAEPDSQRDVLQPDLINAAPKEFARQMRYVAEHYHVMSAHELTEVLMSDKEIPPASLLITFD